MSYKYRTLLCSNEEDACFYGSLLPAGLQPVSSTMLGTGLKCLHQINHHPPWLLLPLALPLEQQVLQPELLEASLKVKVHVAGGRRLRGSLALQRNQAHTPLADEKRSHYTHTFMRCWQ